MNFWSGFVTGMLAMGIITMVTTTTPDQAAQHLREWWQLVSHR